MVSTRRKPSTNSRNGVVYNKDNNEDDESNGDTNTETLDISDASGGKFPLSSSGGIDCHLTSDSALHAVVSEVSSDTNNHLGSSSDTSVVDTPIAPSCKLDSSALNSSLPRISSPSTALKQPPKKKTSKPTKALLAQRNAHTRRNPGNAQLLTGVESITSYTGQQNVEDKGGSRPRGSSLVALNKSSTVQQKESKGGVTGTRNGAPVTKIVMNTGTLYIYTNTHRAEFVRTK